MVEPPTRLAILFVDDEPSIRLTLAAVLRQNGFDVTVAATVAEALREINTQYFDALISDLNIGEPGDGFTVVSAMRRTQPDCINFILTGYPAFETALAAIRNQVDDYLVKPANVQELVAALQSKLRKPRDIRHNQTQSFSEFLRHHATDLYRLALRTNKDAPFAAVGLPGEYRAGHLPELIDEIVRQLESGHPEEPTKTLLAAGAVYGARCREQGYGEEMLAEDVHSVANCIYEIVQNNLLNLELSNLIPSLRHVNSALASYLQESLKAYNIERAA